MSTAARDKPLELLPATLGALYLVAVVRTAWIGDDAFITLRAVDNFIHGLGLVSNPPERVLGFTNPLWAFTLAIPLKLGLSAYAAGIGTGLLMSVAALVWVVWRAAADSISGALAALLMAISGAYVEFSTGGLENPLAHLLLAVFFTAFFAERLTPSRARTWLLAALIVVNRLDHVLLIAPSLVSLLFTRDQAVAPQSGFWRLRPRVVTPFVPVARAILLGSLPLLAWLSFALIYYGFPFPNTAYAKLNTVMPPAKLAVQGLAYFVDDLQRDPITLLVIATAVFGCIKDRTRVSLTLASGVVLYLAYLARIGGDFMAGRFFAAPFLICVVWLAARGLPRMALREVAGLSLVSVALGLLFPNSYRSNERFECLIGNNGIASERYCYAEFTGLVNNIGLQKFLSHGRVRRGLELRRKGHQRDRALASTNVGIMGYFAGPSVHIIDLMALTDPLLARIPYRPGADFRIGHFQREAPEGYAETVATGRNLIKDPCLHAYYDVLSKVISGPLFSLPRWEAIVGLNFGRYDYLMEQPCPLGQ